MGKVFATVIEGTVNALVKWVIVPVTSVIPFLVSSGILLVVYAAMWLAFGTGLVANQQAVAGAWVSIGALPLPVLGLAWLLFLPPMAGLWVWTTSWPLALRLLVIAGLAAWNILVFIPRRQRGTDAAERPVERTDRPAQA